MRLSGIRELDDAHHHLTRWAEWRIRLESSGLGHRSDTVEAKLARDGGVPSGKPASSAVPLGIMSSEVVTAVDAAVRQMPFCLYSVVAHQYLAPGGDQKRLDAWLETEGGTHNDYYRLLQLAKAWVAARLA